MSNSVRTVSEVFNTVQQCSVVSNTVLQCFSGAQLFNSVRGCSNCVRTVWSVQPCLILFSSVQTAFSSVPQCTRTCHAYSGCTWVFLSGLTYSCWVPSHLVSSLPCLCWACYCAKLLLFSPLLSILYRFFSISVLVRLAIVQWDAMTPECLCVLYLSHLSCSTLNPF